MKTASPKRPTPKIPRLSKRKRRSRLHVLKFLPALILVGLAITISMKPHVTPTPHQGVLSYATNISPSDLLANTNSQRAGNGLASLSMNSQLTSAAQTKANDMVARNYWSHVTPDGQEPWTFITGAGYQYTTAGENLAYGFDTSSDTITGWMNSAPHRANILNTSYTQVGFGITNSANFNNDGQQTVIVAMYASPQASQQAAPVVQSTSAAPPAATPPAPTAIRDTAVPADEQVSEVIPVKESTSTSQVKNPVVTTKTATVKTEPVRKIQILTDGKARWSATAIVVSACTLGILYAFQRGLRIKRLALTGEKFIAHHIYLDVTVAALLMLSIAMVATVGNIR